MPVYSVQGENWNRGTDEIVVRVFNKYKASNIGEYMDHCAYVTDVVLPQLVWLGYVLFNSSLGFLHKYCLPGQDFVFSKCFRRLLPSFQGGSSLLLFWLYSTLSEIIDSVYEDLPVVLCLV